MQIVGGCFLCNGYAVYSVVLGFAWSDPHMICGMSCI